MEEFDSAMQGSGGGLLTSSNMSVDTVTYSRADLVAANDEKAVTLIPSMVYVGVMMVLGVVGNTLVCFVFCFRLRPSSQNYLIVYLAVFDLLSSTITMPTGITYMRYNLTFGSEAACKIVWFTNIFCVIGSLWTLFVIALDRFRKICRPLKWQLRVAHIKYCPIPIICATLFFSWPAIVIAGLGTTDSGVPGFPGTGCSTADSMRNTPYPLIYNGILLVSFVGMAITLMAIYCRVLRQTKRHMRFTKHSDFHPTKSQSNHRKDSSSIDYDIPQASLSLTSLPTEEQVQKVITDTPEAGAVSASEPGRLIVSREVLEFSDINLEPKAQVDTSDPSKVEPLKVQGEEKSTTASETPEADSGSLLVTLKRNLEASDISDSNRETKTPEETSDSCLDTMLQLPVQEKLVIDKEDGDTMTETVRVKKKLSFQTDAETGKEFERSTTKKQLSLNESSDKKVDSDLLNKVKPSFQEESLVKYHRSETAELELSSAGDTLILKSENYGETAAAATPFVKSPTEKDSSVIANPQKSQISEAKMFHFETDEHVTSDTLPASQNDGNAVTKSDDTKTSVSKPGVLCISQKTIPSCGEKKEKNESPGKRAQSTSKTTVIAFLVTLVFILSFLPHLCLQISKMISKGYDAKLDGTGLVLYNIFVRSYFLNSILNPFIYGVLNVKFRSEVKNLARQAKTICKRK